MNCILKYEKYTKIELKLQLIDLLKMLTAAIKLISQRKISVHNFIEQSVWFQLKISIKLNHMVGHHLKKLELAQFTRKILDHGYAARKSQECCPSIRM